MAVTFKVNGAPVAVDAPAATPLLWVIREHVKLTGTKFGCGAGMCGACIVHIDGDRAFSCQTQLSEVAGRSVTTIEGLSPTSSHPVQKAWLAENVPQCGYCQSGQIMSAAALLEHRGHAAPSVFYWPHRRNDFRTTQRQFSGRSAMTHGSCRPSVYRCSAIAQMPLMAH
jgi:isoquinoline 1-oxidoreductase alpha subunit